MICAFSAAAKFCYEKCEHSGSREFIGQGGLRQGIMASNYAATVQTQNAEVLG